MVLDDISSRFSMKNNNGFTLLEVMIAITIFALIATTLSKVSATTVDNHIHLERKLLATWIAENDITELRSVPFANIKNGTKELTYADRDWIIKRNVKPIKQFSGIPIPLEIKELSVSVSLAESEDSPLQTLSAYLTND